MGTDCAAAPRDTLASPWPVISASHPRLQSSAPSPAFQLPQVLLKHPANPTDQSRSASVHHPSTTSHVCCAAAGPSDAEPSCRISCQVSDSYHGTSLDLCCHLGIQMMGNARPAETCTSILAGPYTRRRSSHRDRHLSAVELGGCLFWAGPANQLEFFPLRAHQWTCAVNLSCPFPPLIDATVFDADLQLCLKLLRCRYERRAFRGLSSVVWEGQLACEPPPSLFHLLGKVLTRCNIGG